MSTVIPSSDPRPHAIKSLNDTFTGKNNSALVALAYMATVISGGTITALAYAIAAMVDAAKHNKQADLKDKVTKELPEAAKAVMTDKIARKLLSFENLATEKLRQVSLSTLTDELKSEKNHQLGNLYKDANEAREAVEAGESLEVLESMYGPMGSLAKRLNAPELQFVRVR